MMHSTPLPGNLDAVPHLKRKMAKIDYIETTQSTSKKPRMAVPVPSSSTIR